MPKLLFNLPPRQHNGLKHLSSQTGLSVAELLRRMIDQCMQDGAVDRLVPPMSGRMTTRQRA